MFIISLGTAIASYFIPNTLGVVLFMTGCGFILSLNLNEIGLTFKYTMISCLASSKFKNTSSCRTQFVWKELMSYFIVLTFALLEAGLLHFFLGFQTFSKTSLQGVISYILIVLLLALWILREIQTVYLFGLFRNPFYPKDLMTMNVSGRKEKNLKKIGMLRKILLTLGKKSQFLFYISTQRIKCILWNYEMCLEPGEGGDDQIRNWVKAYFQTLVSEIDFLSHHKI